MEKSCSITPERECEGTSCFLWEATENTCIRDVPLQYDRHRLQQLLNILNSMKKIKKWHR